MVFENLFSTPRQASKRRSNNPEKEEFLDGAFSDLDDRKKFICRASIASV